MACVNALICQRVDQDVPEEVLKFFGYLLKMGRLEGGVGLGLLHSIKMGR